MNFMFFTAFFSYSKTTLRSANVSLLALFESAIGISCVFGLPRETQSTACPSSCRSVRTALPLCFPEFRISMYGGSPNTKNPASSLDFAFSTTEIPMRSENCKSLSKSFIWLLALQRLLQQQFQALHKLKNYFPAFHSQYGA